MEKRMLPGFVYLDEIDSSILQDIKYFSDDNFMGRVVAGYKAARCVLVKEAALALATIQQQLKPHSMSLKVFDGYRPQTAVDDFIAWSKDPADQKMKEDFYPRVDKPDLFKLNYLAEKSSHSRGSTVDLTIVKLAEDGSHLELEMGTPFDYLDELSHPASREVSQEAYDNRQLLLGYMEEAGFSGIETEWWHFTLKEEVFPETYFDFIV